MKGLPALLEDPVAEVRRAAAALAGATDSSAETVAFGSGGQIGQIARRGGHIAIGIEESRRGFRRDDAAPRQQLGHDRVAADGGRQ